MAVRAPPLLALATCMYAPPPLRASRAQSRFTQSINWRARPSTALTTKHYERYNYRKRRLESGVLARISLTHLQRQLFFN